MDVFWYIYAVGVVVALFLITDEFKKWCLKNRIDPNTATSDYNVLLMIVIDSLGSWISVGFWWFTREKD